MNRLDLTWKPYVSAVSSAWQQGNHYLVAEILMQALKDSEDLGEVNADLTRATHFLAQQFSERRQYAAAEKLCLKVLEVQEKLLGPAHEYVADSLRRVCAIRNLSRLCDLENKSNSRQLRDWGCLIVSEEEPDVQVLEKSDGPLQNVSPSLKQSSAAEVRITQLHKCITRHMSATTS